jgi:hypothetical protein
MDRSRDLRSSSNPFKFSSKYFYFTTYNNLQKTPHFSLIKPTTSIEQTARASWHKREKHDLVALADQPSKRHTRTSKPPLKISKCCHLLFSLDCPLDREKPFICTHSGSVISMKLPIYHKHSENTACLAMGTLHLSNGFLERDPRQPPTL